MIGATIFQCYSIQLFDYSIFNYELFNRSSEGLFKVPDYSTLNCYWKFNAQCSIVTGVPSIIVILKVYSLFNCHSTIVKMSKFRSYCSNSENCSSLLTQWCRSIVICQHAKVRTLKLLIINCRY